MRNSEEKRLQRVVAYFCAALFALFSFFFVAEYQAPLLELVYDELATGKLGFNPCVAGGVVAVALTMLAIWLNKISGFQREWTAMAYLPSTLLLAFITDIDRSVYTGGWSPWNWVIVFLLGLLVYLFLSFILRRVLFEKIKNVAMSLNRVLWRNLMLFVVFFAMVGTLSNGEENFKREALVASYYKNGDLDAALNVGYKSLDASQQLTAQRAYVMACEGLLGEKVFEYPQLYGSDGLIPKSVRTSVLVPDSAYALLGTPPVGNEGAMQYLERTVGSDSATSVAKEFYLTALLLDKRLVEFARKLPAFYPETSVDSLPKHFREALFLHSEIDGTYSPAFSSDTLAVLFDSLRNIERCYDDVFVRGNYVRRSFGRTYWWYFLYSN